MPNTPNNLPYPSRGDAPDVAAHIQNLASAADTLIDKRTPRIWTFNRGIATTLSGGETKDDAVTVNVTLPARVWLSALLAVRINSFTSGTPELIVSLLVDGNTVDTETIDTVSATGAAGTTRLRVPLAASLDLAAGAHTVLARVKNNTVSVTGLFSSWRLNAVSGVAAN